MKAANRLTENTRQRLVEDARDMQHRIKSGEITLASEVMTLPASVYSSQQRFAMESALFRKLPLMLAASCELAAVGDYKAMEVASIPVLITRAPDGKARAFLNSCTHRGAQLVEGSGSAARFTCPYHGWTFKSDGSLLGIASSHQYGEVDKQKSGLVELPLYESQGLIWVILSPDSTYDIPDFLHGVDQMLAGFGLQNWKLFRQVSLPGANWKLAFDAHMDFYHLPVLHKNTFGPQISNLAQYYFYGPHQRLGLMSENSVEQVNLNDLESLPEEQWPDEALLFGEWILFPNVSLNCFRAGERVMVISQIFPGESVETSTTVQTYLVENTPNADTLEPVSEFVDFITKVVGEEDLPMSTKQQRALSSGLLPTVQFGRNELGLQRYHTELQAFLDQQCSGKRAN